MRDTSAILLLAFVALFAFLLFACLGCCGHGRNVHAGVKASGIGALIGFMCGVGVLYLMRYRRINRIRAAFEGFDSPNNPNSPNNPTAGVLPGVLPVIVDDTPMYTSLQTLLEQVKLAWKVYKTKRDSMAKATCDLQSSIVGYNDQTLAAGYEADALPASSTASSTTSVAASATDAQRAQFAIQASTAVAAQQQAWQISTKLKMFDCAAWRNGTSTTPVTATAVSPSSNVPTFASLNQCDTSGSSVAGGLACGNKPCGPKDLWIATANGSRWMTLFTQVQALSKEAAADIPATTLINNEKWAQDTMQPSLDSAHSVQATEANLGTGQGVLASSPTQSAVTEGFDVSATGGMCIFRGDLVSAEATLRAIWAQTVVASSAQDAAYQAWMSADQQTTAMQTELQQFSTTSQSKHSVS